jgi:phenylacetate-coenzyme A ligase PaaK-like adenylate-forming protein
MSDLEIKRPDDAQEIQVEGQTVPFYKYKIGDTTYIEFDTSRCGPPEPMVNAMLALKEISSMDNAKVVMINHKKPMGLLPKVEGEYDIAEQEAEGGNVKLIFSKKENPTAQTDFNDTNCHG